MRCREDSFDGADGVVAHRSGFGMRFEKWFVSDHHLGFALSRSRFAPVRGASVASRLFIDRAATPPHEEGNLAE
jgi:hypothetical protein